MRFAILAACVAATVVLSGEASAQQAGANGKTLYEQNCKSCHGVQGIPSAAMVKMMKVPALDTVYFRKRTEDTVALVLKKGRGKMRPFADKLTAEQMMAVARYVREMAIASK